MCEEVCRNLADGENFWQSLTNAVKFAQHATLCFVPTRALLQAEDNREAGSILEKHSHVLPACSAIQIDITTLLLQ